MIYNAGTTGFEQGKVADHAEHASLADLREVHRVIGSARIACIAKRSIRSVVLYGLLLYGLT